MAKNSGLLFLLLGLGWLFTQKKTAKNGLNGFMKQPYLLGNGNGYFSTYGTNGLPPDTLHLESEDAATAYHARNGNGITTFKTPDTPIIRGSDYLELEMEDRIRAKSKRKRSRTAPVSFKTPEKTLPRQPDYLAIEMEELIQARGGE